MPLANDPEGQALEEIGFGFAVRWRHVLAAQREMTLHEPNGSASLIKQPYDGYQTLYVSKMQTTYMSTPRAMFLAVPDLEMYSVAVYAIAAGWQRAKLNFELALSCLLPECGAHRLYVLQIQGLTQSDLTAQAQLMTQRLRELCGLGNVWLPEQPVEVEDVAPLIADPPDWAYFEDPPCK